MPTFAAPSPTTGMLRDVHAAGRLATPASAATIVDRVMLGAQVVLGRSPPTFTDDLLPTLIDEMLFDPVSDVRLYASLLIDATPYRQPVAAAVAVELAKPQVVGDVTLAGSMLSALRVLGGPPQRPLIERLVLATGLPAAVPAAAARHIGHVGGSSVDGFWLTAIAMHGRRLAPASGEAQCGGPTRARLRTGHRAQQPPAHAHSGRPGGPAAGP